MMLYAFFFYIIPRIKSTSEQFEEIIFTQNETIEYPTNSYFVPFNTSQQLNDKIQNNQYFELINIVKTFYVAEVNNESKLHVFHYKSKQQLKVCIQNRKDVLCKLTIETTFINNELQFNEIHQVLQLPFENCEQISYLNLGIYIVLCKINQNQYLLIILKEDGKIQDSFQFMNEKNCQFKYDLLTNTVLLYSQGCLKIQLWMIGIDQEKYLFNSKEQIEIEKVLNRTLGYLQKAQICQNNHLLLLFENILIKYQITDQTIFKMEFFNQSVIIQTEECKLQFVVGLEGKIRRQLQDDETNVNPNVFLPFSSSQIKKFAEINENLLVQTENQLIIFHNQELNQTFNSIIDFTTLLKLPFVISLNNNQTISIIKINQISYIIPYSYANFIAVLQKSNFNHINNSEIILKIKNLDMKNVSEIINIETKRKELFFRNDWPIMIDNFYEFFPIFNLDLKSNEVNIQVFKTNNLKCKIKTDHSIIFKKVALLSINSILIFFQVPIKNHLNSYSNYLIRCKNNVTSQSLFLTNSEQSQQIIFNPNYVILNDNFSVTCIVFSHEQQIIDQQTIVFKNEITKVFIKKNFVYVILSNSKQYQIIISNKIELIENIYQNIQKERQLQIESSYQIRLEKKNQQQFDQIIKLNCQIIDQYHYVSLNRFIVLCLHQDDLISIYLYSYNDQNINFLYEMPTYNFRIQTPLQISYYQLSFCIIAKNKNFTGSFLLFYNIDQKFAIKSLYQIKHIMNNNNTIQLLSFLQKNFLAYCEENFCETINLDAVLVFFYQQKISDEYQIKSEAILKASSFIFQEQREILLFLSCLNQDQHLRFRLNVKQQDQFLYNNPKNQLIGIQQIFGQIDNVTVSPECQGQLINPIEHINKTSFSFVCKFLQGQFCFNQGQLIYDMFGIHIVLSIPIEIISVKLILQDQNQLKIFYLANNHQLMILIVDDWNQNNPKLTNHKLNIEADLRISKLHHIGNILYTQYHPMIIVLNSTDYSHVLAEKEFEEIYGEIIYVEQYGDNQFKYIQISKTNKGCLKLIQFQVSNQGIERTLEIDIESKEVHNFVCMVFHNAQKNLNLLKLKLIIHQSLIEKSERLLCYFEIIFDLQSNMIVEEKITHYFRTQLEHGEEVINLQIFNNILVKSVYQNQLQLKNNKICLYDLNQDSLNFKFNDYFYSTQVESQTTFHNYNDQYQIICNDLDVNLIKIQMYQLQLPKYQKQCQIQLNNQVSFLPIFVKSISSQQNQIFLYAILALDFAFIIFAFLRKHKKIETPITQT